MSEITIIFPGQGSQFIGMGKALCEEYRTAEETFEEASSHLGFDIGRICFRGSMMELNRIENMFPAILTASVALFRVYMEEIGIAPALTAGHSLGEYSALVCSGVMEFGDALKIVRIRAQLADDPMYTQPGTMTVINGIDRETVEKECKIICSRGITVGIACYNSVDQLVVSGKNDGILELEDKVIELGAQITPMLMSPPLHSPLMLTASEKLRQELEQFRFGTPRWPVISNVSALPYGNEAEDIINNLARQMIMPVRWSDTMEYMKAQGTKIIIEMGNQAILTNIAKNNNYGFETYSFGQKNDRNTLLQKISHKAREKKQPQTVPDAGIISRCLAIAVSVPNSNWNTDEYIKGVEEPYELIQGIQDELDKERRITGEQVKAALAALKTILNTKGVPGDEQTQLFDELLSR